METLKIDIDIKEFKTVKSIIVNRCGAVLNILSIIPLACTVYSTAKGYHIYLDVAGEFNSFDVCFLQMALGSDYKRETFNFMRFRDHLDKKWNVLFAKKYDENRNLISQEVSEETLTLVLWEAIKERMKSVK